MAYVRVNWVDGSGGGTPVDATNLNVMDAGISDLSTGTLQAGDSAKLGGVAAANFPQVGTHNGVTFTLSAGTTLPGTLDANEIFFLLA